MNPVWQKLNLGMVLEVMHLKVLQIIKDERVEYARHIVETYSAGMYIPDEMPFAEDFCMWFGCLVTSQKHVINFSNKENKHNHTLLGIQERHSKITLAGRSVDQQEEDELRATVQVTLDNWLQTSHI